MYLKKLLLRNFRNYGHSELNFSPRINLILGDNGHGKTNLLEAIHFISTGRSFRARALSDLIYFGQSYFYLEAEFEKDGVCQSIKVYYDKSARKIQYNDTVYPSLTPLLGILPSVLISPDDVSLVSGSPAERRRFLDVHISQTDPLYVNHLGRYYKAMKQRNFLLRAKSEGTMSAWEQVMAQSASYLVHKRKHMIESLAATCSAWLRALSQEKETLTIHYESSMSSVHAFRVAEDLQNVWRKMRSKDMQFGSTLVGPHRDDLIIQIADKPAKFFSSEGQKRSCISSLRFAQWEEMCKTTGSSPMLGIDDFGIQLDRERLLQLKRHLSKFHQLFLTSPVPIAQDFGAEYQVLSIAQGRCL